MRWSKGPTNARYWMVSVLLVFVALGCKAESVGVEVPRGGPDAISMEDLQRDVFLVEDNRKGREAGVARSARAWRGLEDRLRQMHLVPAYGRGFVGEESPMVLCGRKDGTGGGVVLVAAEDDPAQPGASSAGLATLVSLAKAWDVPLPPERTLLFCAWSGTAGHDAFVAHPPVKIEDIEGGIVMTVPGREAFATLPVSTQPIDTDEKPERVDFRAIRDHAVRLDGLVRGLVNGAH